MVEIHTTCFTHSDLLNKVGQSSYTSETQAHFHLTFCLPVIEIISRQKERDEYIKHVSREMKMARGTKK